MDAIDLLSCLTTGIDVNIMSVETTVSLSIVS